MGQRFFPLDFALDLGNLPKFPSISALRQPEKSLTQNPNSLVRTQTKQRMKERLKDAYGGYLNESVERDSMDQKLQSYLGILTHANQHTLSQALQNAYWVREGK